MDDLQKTDPFDPASLRLDQSFNEGAGVKKLLPPFQRGSSIGRNGCVFTAVKINT